LPRYYIILFVVVTTILLTSCQLFQSLSPEGVIENALSATNEPRISFSGTVQITSEGVLAGDFFEEATIKEWHDGERYRNDIIANKEALIMIVDNHDMMIYDVNENKVSFLTEDELRHNAIAMNPKEQLHELLRMLRDTHNVDVAAGETILGRSTVHLQAYVKDDTKSLFGNLDMWIDDEYWLPLKMTMMMDDVEVTLRYTDINFNDKIDDSVFEFVVPDDATVEWLDDTMVEHHIALSDIPEIFGRSVYVIAEQDGITIDEISSVMIDETTNDQMVTIEYKYERAPGFSLVIAEWTEVDEQMFDDDDFTKEFSETITVRDRDAILFDFQDLQFINWEENGLSYHIQRLNPKLDVHKLIQLINGMGEIQ